MGVWVVVAIGVLAFSVCETPRVYGLAWSAPWVMAVVLLGLEISRRAEHDLMVVSSILITMFYFSCRALELFFYFETAGLPLLLRIIIVGRQPQKVEAAKYMLFYIAFAALPLLFIISKSGATASCMFTALGSVVILPFLAKMPAYILHAWLPKAHVEARTPGSIVLAGRVIKLGTYGVLSWNLHSNMRVLGCAVVGLGVVLVGSALIRGVDRKTLVAYSSVLHIAVGLVAWVGCSARGWYGVLYSNVAHTILRPMIFLGVSIFYGIQGGRDRSTIRGWMRWSFASVALVFVFLVNGGMPPALLSGCEVLICIGRGMGVLGLVVIRTGIFVSGLWTLRISADQGRRLVKPAAWFRPAPIILSCLLSITTLPLLV